MTRFAPQTDLSLIVLVIFFKLPFAPPAATFDLPGILYQPPEAILTAFTAGGSGLILTWYAFALAALLFIPAGLAHAFAGNRVTTAPALVIPAAMISTLSGLMQALGPSALGSGGANPVRWRSRDRADL